MSKLRQAGMYVKIVLWLVVGGYALLYFAGLIPQQAVDDSVQLSASQLVEEGYNPVVLVRSDESYRLDNFSETRILLESLYLNTRHNPQAVLACPTYEGGGNPIAAINDVAELGGFPDPDTYFPHMIMGFRSLVRPLLAFMNLRQIRRLLMWITLLLFTANVVNIKKRSGTLIAFLFAAAFLSVNPILVMSSLQYSCCFLVAFTVMLLMPYIDRWKMTEPMLFFLVGGLTQYLDLYTTPLITFGLPILWMLLIKQQNGQLQSFQEDVLCVVRCFGAWLGAYVLMWLVNIGVVALFTDFNVWKTAVEAVASGVGFGAARVNAFTALSAGLTNLVTIECTLCLIGFIIAWPFMMDTRAKRATGYRQGRIFLLVALLPIAWCLIAANSMMKNAYYQYRILIVTIFGVLCFYAKPTQYMEKNMQNPYHRILKKLEVPKDGSIQ